MTLGQGLRRLGALMYRFTRPHWRSVALVLAANVLMGVALTLRPVVLSPALDSFSGTRSQPADRLTQLTLNNVGPTLSRALGLQAADSFHTGLYVSVLFVGVTVAVATLGLASQVLLTSVRASVQRDMMVALHAHLLTLPLSYFHRRKAGDLVTHLTQEVNSLASTLDSVLRSGVPALSQVAIGLLILLRTDALFSVSILLMGTTHLLITRALSGRVWRLAGATSGHQANVGASLLETFVGIRAVKSFAAEGYESKRVWDAAEAHRRLFRKMKIVADADTPIRLVADALVAAVLLSFTFYAVSQGRLTLQAAALFFYLSQQLIAPVSQLFRQWLALSQVVGGGGHVLEMFEMRSAMVEGTRTAGVLTDGITLEKVAFAFTPGRPVLSGIDLKIRRRETVALVGPSGAGKTTLADLILRLYDPQEGTIRYDGTDVREFRQASYRRHFGVVAQESLLFNATLRDNIVYNRPEDAAALARAIWVANAEDFVRDLPQGLDTVVGDRGVRLSGGQRQRVAIARAVYAQPSLLVLDEATSALDSESEREVQKALERVGRETTTLVIAHRLSTIMHADRVVVLSGGRIEAAGPHAQLLETSPTYRRLYDLQFAAPLG